MLEFYPLPTNLNGGGLYAHHHHSHHHHHHAIGTTRFLDNTTNNCVSVSPATINATSAAINAAISTNNNNNNNNNNNMQPQQQQQQHLTDNNNSNSKKLSTIISTTSAAIVTAALAESTLTSYTDANISSTITCLPTACAATTLVPTAAATTTTTTIMVPPTNNNNSNNNNNNNNNSNNNKSSGDCSGRTEVDCIKCEKNFEICEGCGQKIHDRYLMNVGDTNWHEQCLACCYCGMQLHHTCYVRNMKLYCKLDYDRIFGIKCAACCHPVLPQEMVMRPIPNYVFHLSCFVCYACRLPLQKGEQFILRDGQLFCFRHDLEKELYLSAAAAAAQHCGYVGLDEDDLIRTRDGRRGPKRPRTILTSQQRKQFKASFDQSPKPCRKVREALAKDTGLSVRVVQVWFQNQRAKMKKIQRKAKNGGGTSSSTNNNERNADDKDKDKDDKSIKQESGSGSEGGGYLGLEQSFASQPLNPNLPFSPDDYPAHSNDSFCSSDLSLDGSNFDQLDDDGDSLSLNNFELQSTGSSSNHRQHSNPHDMIANLHTSLINPIDKLYLMQNSYFATE